MDAGWTPTRFAALDPQVRAALKSLNVDVSRAGAADVLAAYDADGSGLMEIEEFAKLVSRLGNGGATPRGGDDESLRGLIDGYELEAAEVSFLDGRLPMRQACCPPPLCTHPLPTLPCHDQYRHHHPPLLCAPTRCTEARRASSRSAICSRSSRWSCACGRTTGSALASGARR